MLANDLAEKLKSLGLTDNPSVRVATLEADVPIGVVVKTPLGGLTVTPEMPGYITGAIQVIVRHIDPMAGDRLSREVVEALTVYPGSEPVTLDNYQLNSLYPTTEPIMFPVNLAALFEFSINFMCTAIRL